MSFPSQVCMSDVPLFMTQGYIMNVIQKLGHHPIRATISKDKKAFDKAVCTVQFANVDAAREAVLQLNGKSVSISGSGSTATTFKLSQGTENNQKLYNVLVRDLAPEIDDFNLFKFFGDRFKSLCDAKVIVDNEGKSRGFGFLAFTSEEDQKFCIKIMDGSLDLGNRAIKVSSVITGPPVNRFPVDMYAFRIMSGDPWCRYTSWNQFIEPAEYPFIAVKVNLTACKDNKDSKDDKDLKDSKDKTSSNDDRGLVKYNVTSNTDYLNHEILERDCHFWDALECSKWLPLMALNLPPSDYAEPPAESEAQAITRKHENSRNLSNGTPMDVSEVKEVSDGKNSKNLKRTSVPSKFSTSKSSKVVKKSVSKVVGASRLLRGKYDLRERAKMAGGVVKRSAVPRASTLATASKIKAKYLTKPPLQRVSTAAAQRISSTTAGSQSSREPSARKLMDKLADEIHDSLTKLFTHKRGSASSKLSRTKPAPPMRLDKKHPAEKLKPSLVCFKCGRRGHSSTECLLPGRGKPCFNCMKITTHVAKDCKEAPARMANTIRTSRGSCGRAPSPSRPLPRRMRSRSPSNPSSSRAGRQSIRGSHPSVRGGRPSIRGNQPSVQGGRPSVRGGPSGFKSGLQRFPSSNLNRGPTNSRLEVPKCRICGHRGHPSNECFKKDSACHVCGKKGHLALVCRFR